MDRPRVLVIAEAANPEWVSVPLVGWSHGRALAQVADVHMVTQIRNREAILRAGLDEGSDFSVVDSEPVARPLWRLGNLLRGGAGKGWTTATALSSLPYYYFENELWKGFRHELVSGSYDLVHRITPLSPTTPSILASRCERVGVPFVLGPLNGGVPWPKTFRRARHQEREWLSYLRGVYRLLPGYRATRQSAAAIIVASRATFEQIPAAYHQKCVYIPENGIDPSRFSLKVNREVVRPLRLVFVGRLVPYKGADMLVEAAAPLARAGKVVLDLIGDGPMLPGLQKTIEREGVSDCATLAGWVPHDQIQHRLIRSDVLAFPSIREFGGATVLEAMALGLVPLVVDYGGPGELVTAETGYKLPIGSRDEIVARLRGVLSRLAEDPAHLREMGRKARQHVMDLYSWEAKARQTLEVYRWVLGQRPDRPDFGMPLSSTAKSG
jgi:glycosyltransferase involved in cell wall biosynthesis